MNGGKLAGCYDVVAKGMAAWFSRGLDPAGKPRLSLVGYTGLFLNPEGKKREVQLWETGKVG